MGEENVVDDIYAHHSSRKSIGIGPAVALIKAAATGRLPKCILRD